MVNKITFDISNFEPISENTENKLIGGFSQSQSSSVRFDFNVEGNNCQGGNCVEGCGSGQNIGCNAVAGCGVVIKK